MYKNSFYYKQSCSAPHDAILSRRDSCLLLSGSCADKNCFTTLDAKVQSAYKLSEYFAKPYFHKYWTEIHVTTIWKRNVCSFISDHDVQIAVGMHVEPPQNCHIAQIPEHTNYARSVRQPFPSNIGLRISREITVATIGRFQILHSLCVIDTNFTILRHFLRNPPIIYTHPV
jgi:hypothetical protein